MPLLSFREWLDYHGYTYHTAVGNFAIHVHHRDVIALYWEYTQSWLKKARAARVVA